jgi:DNA-binding transcriptional regulator YiaG
MPNIATVFKAEIARVARKQLRAETTGLKQAVLAHRSEIAALKRRIKGLEQALRQLGRTRARPAAEPQAESDSSQSLRFSAKGFASNRRRLGLSAEACGLLVGTSGQSVYQWERGKVRPRARHLAAIAALRTLGKREANARLEALRK